MTPPTTHGSPPSSSNCCHLGGRRRLPPGGLRSGRHWLGAVPDDAATCGARCMGATPGLPQGEQPEKRQPRSPRTHRDGVIPEHGTTEAEHGDARGYTVSEPRRRKCAASRRRTEAAVKHLPRGGKRGCRRTTPKARNFLLAVRGSRSHDKAMRTPYAEDGRGAGEARTAPDAPLPRGPQGGRLRVTWLLNRAAQ